MHPYMRRRQRKGRGHLSASFAGAGAEANLGVPLFQEQLLRIAMTVANFTGAEAEELRRAVGMRRSWERMKNLEGKLRAGMTANGHRCRDAGDHRAEHQLLRAVRLSRSRMRPASR